MKNINAQLLWYALQKLIANIIVFIAYQRAIMLEITFNIALHNSLWMKLTRNFLPWCLLMTNINAQFVLQKFNEKIIVLHIAYQWAIISGITSNITLHRSKCNKLVRHFLPIWLLMININAQFILQKLITNIIVFKIASQCYLSEITLIITLHRSKSNKLLSYFLQCRLLMINIKEQIVLIALQILNAKITITYCISMYLMS